MLLNKWGTTVLTTFIFLSLLIRLSVYRTVFCIIHHGSCICGGIWLFSLYNWGIHSAVFAQVWYMCIHCEKKSAVVSCKLVMVPHKYLKKHLLMLQVPLSVVSNFLCCHLCNSWRNYITISKHSDLCGLCQSVRHHMQFLCMSINSDTFISPWG